MAPQASTAKPAAASNAEPGARPSLSLTRRFNAPPEKVYAAWADPQKLVQWFGPASVEEGSVKADMDLRVGGRYRISFRANGNYNEVGGVYREVVPNQRLVFSWAWHSTPERESLVTVSVTAGYGAEESAAPGEIVTSVLLLVRGLNDDGNFEAVGGAVDALLTNYRLHTA